MSMKPKITLLLLFILFGFNNVFSQFTPQKPDLRLCGSAPNYYQDYFNCTSNNYTLDQVFLSLTNVNGVPLSNTTCIPGSTEQMYVMLNYTSNSNSNITQTRIFADLSIDGTIIPINKYLGNVAPGGGQREIYGPFTWTCGTRLSLCRILVVWQTNGGANDPELSSYTCNTYSKSQCEFSNCMLVAAPLAVQFNYSVCTSGNQSTVTFQNTTSGGEEPYSFHWDFGDGTTSTQQPPPPIVHNYPYPGGPYTVTLTVTDSNLPNHLVSTYTQIITPPAPISVPGVVTSANCSTGNGSIQVNPTGGTPPYTYSWSSGGSSTSNSGSLPPGSYTVTVTDHFGCVKSQTFIIGPGDTVPPVVNASDFTIEGCGTVALGNQNYLAYSTTSVALNLNDPNLANILAANHISFIEANPISISYQDVASGSCPIVITRTWTVNDQCGSSSDTQAISIDDTLPPVPPTAPQNATYSCAGDIPAAPSLSATDGCSVNPIVGVLSVQTTPGGCPNNYTLVRTWTFTDACGNPSSISQTITVNDNIKPTVPSAPASVTVKCIANVPIAAVLYATDNCNGTQIQGVLNEQTTAGSCPNNYTIVRTWTFTDACNNSDSVSQTITVNDDIKPTLPAAPAAVTVKCAESVPAPAVLYATDNCANTQIQGVLSVQTNQGSCANKFTIIRTWTFTDACNNSDSVSQTITVNDDIKPTLPAAPANLNLACASSVPAAATLFATDNCNGTQIQGVLSEQLTPGSCSNKFTLVRTWTFTDACNNSDSVSQTIVVNDNLAPVPPTAPANITVVCSSEIPAMSTLTANDNCSGSISVSGHDSITGGSCSGNYSITRTWTFVDDCGNSSSISQIINVADTSVPDLETPPADVTVSCIDQVPAMISLTATDSCSESGSVQIQGVDTVVAGNCPNSFIITRTWAYTDPCGNSSSEHQTIYVIDNLPPVAPEAPANVTVSCGSEIPAMISLTANDACSGSITVSGVDSAVQGNCPNSYVVTRTWTFVDACGNPTSISQTITVKDEIAPVPPTAPEAVTVHCIGDVPATISLTATDNCGTQITAQGVDVIVQGNCPDSYVITRTWTFTDACNNTSTVSQTINVVDDVAPVPPTAPADITYQCAAEVPAAQTLTAADNCGQIIEGVPNDLITQGNCPNSYTIKRTWSFTDDCGNTSTTEQMITVKDDLAPVPPTAPADITVSCNREVPAGSALTAIDNCNGEIIAQPVDVISNASESCPNSYTITRTWTFTDLCNNSAAISQIITVKDELAPVPPTAPENVTVSCGSEIPAMISLTAIDNCNDEITVEGSDQVIAGECRNSYSVIRTWTFIDACGNRSSVSQTIIVKDEIKPQAPVAPADVTVSCQGEVPAMISLTAIDNCSDPITVSGVDSIAQGDCANSYVITRTWTFVDDCGNVSDVSQTITVNDETSPIPVNVPENITVSCEGEIPAMISLNANDNCSDVLTVLGVDTRTEGSCPNSFVVTRTWSFADACGNQATATQIITVKDESAPVLVNAPVSQNVNCINFVGPSALTFTDNCTDVIVVEPSAPVYGGLDDDDPQHYTATYTWTATDSCGNQTVVTQVFNITVDKYFDAENPDLCNNDTAYENFNLMSLLPEGTEAGGIWSSEMTDANLDALLESLINHQNSTLNVTQLPVGYYTVEYSLTPNESHCPRKYDFYIHVVDDCGVLAACSITVYNAVSPNNDGLNDVFDIDGIECYLENNVQIYNRWGILVFDKDGYNNTTVVFDGKSNARSTLNRSEELPDGTYFYILKYKDNETGNWKDRSGYLYLNR